MGLGDTLGNIGVALAGQPRRAKTPTFLPPGAPIGPTPSAPPNAPPPPPPPTVDPGDDESYDYTKPTPSLAGQIGGNIGDVRPGQPKYQSAEDRLQNTLEHPPARPKSGIWRELGGNILMGMGPIGHTLGSKLAYGDYPQKLGEYQANVEAQTLAAKQAIAAREEQRKIEQNQNQTAESKARREDLTKTREATAANQTATRQLEGQKAASAMLGSGEGKLYQAPPPVTANVPPPAGVPGLAATQATVPSPPKPPDVQNIGGMDIQLGQKPKEYKTAEEAAMAVLGDATLAPEVVKQKLDAIAKAHNVLHPQTPIHSFQDDDSGNVTMLVVDPANPSAVKQVPLGKIGKTKTQPDPTRANDKRGDTSYQFNIGELNKLGKPIEDLGLRLGRLEDTIAQNSPQADALVAPELLTVMAGGQGSGLRMNEAEIARLVGGRSNWETLKASINKWQLDPSKALSITPAQRQQIRALVTQVGTKIRAKQSVLDDARSALLNAESPEQHRKILSDTHRAVTAIDGGSGRQQQKIFPASQVHAYAMAHGITDDAAKAAITNSGSVIQ